MKAVEGGFFSEVGMSSGAFDFLGYVPVLALSVVVLTGLGEVSVTLGGAGLLAWKWHRLPGIPGLSACLPFQLIHLTWALIGLLLCSCPAWSRWYQANRSVVAGASLLVGWILDAVYFMQTEDALPYMAVRALVVSLIASLGLPAPIRLRLFAQGSGFLLCAASILLRPDATSVSAVLCMILLLGHTTAAALSLFRQDGFRVEQKLQGSGVKGPGGEREVKFEAAGEMKSRGEEVGGRGQTNGKPGSQGGQSGSQREEEKLGPETFGVGKEGSVLEFAEAHSELGVAQSSQHGGFVVRSDGGVKDNEEEEEDDFEERIMELAAAPGTVRDSSDTIFTGRPNATAARVGLGPDPAVASLFRDRAMAKGSEGGSSAGVSIREGHARTGSLVLSNEERMATTTGRLIALAGAAGEKVSHRRVQSGLGIGGSPNRGEQGLRPTVTPANPRLSLTRSLPATTEAGTKGHSVGNLAPTGPSSGSGLGEGGFSKPAGSRKGKEKVVKDEEPSKPPKVPKNVVPGLRMLPGISEREREALEATYAVVSAARAAEAIGANRPWGTGLSQPVTELDYRAADAGGWRSPEWTGLGEDWLTWMQDMFFMGPGWDGGISRVDDDQKAKAQAEEDEEDSEDDESYNFDKMEEKYRGLLGGMGGFGVGGRGMGAWSDVRKKEKDVSWKGGDVSRKASDVSKKASDVISAGQVESVSLGGLGSGVEFAAQGEPLDSSGEEESGEEDLGEEDDWDEMEGLDSLKEADPDPNPAPNPWAIAPEQRRGLLEMISRREPSGVANAGPFEPSFLDSSPAKDFSVVSAPHFVLDASSPVLKVQRPAENVLSHGPGVLESNVLFESAETDLGLASKLMPRGPNLQTPSLNPQASQPNPQIPGPNPQTSPPQLLDPQLSNSGEATLQAELEERLVGATKAQSVGDCLSFSEQISQLLAAPSFTLDATAPVAIGADLPLTSPKASPVVPVTSPKATPPPINPEEVHPADLLATSEHYAKLLAAPSFTLDASVPAVPLRGPGGELAGIAGLSGGLTGTGGLDSGLERAMGGGYGLERTIDLSGRLEGTWEKNDSRERGGSLEGLLEHNVYPDSTAVLNPEVGPETLFPGGSERDSMTLRSGRSYPSAPKMTPAASIQPWLQAERGAMQGTGEGTVLFGGKGQTNALLDYSVAPVFTLDASRGQHGMSEGNSGDVSAPVFQLDASRSLAGFDAASIAPAFKLDASRHAETADFGAAFGVASLAASKLGRATQGALTNNETNFAPSFTLDASRHSEVASGSGVSGKAGSDGYAWTQMSERLAKRSNGRGMSKVDQEWLKVMERVKYRLPQVQDGWKPELHIPFAALGN